ncbi:DnaB-like helicase C-terminal domain-containing protein [Prochlorothrix hollandica]|uniref:DnaB-like helicase C-terminal domain-containing protein n=1 Tax=Prochlorothrix hollandica TaxID=1223 RepID=UPI00333F6203
MQNNEIEDAVIGVLFNPAFHSFQDGQIHPDLLNLAQGFQEGYGRNPFFSQRGYQSLWVAGLNVWKNEGAAPSYAILAPVYLARSTDGIPELRDFIDAAYDASPTIAEKGDVSNQQLRLWLKELYALALRRSVSRELTRISESLSDVNAEWDPSRIENRIRGLLDDVKMPAADTGIKLLYGHVIDLLGLHEKVTEGEALANTLMTGDDGFDKMVSFVRGNVAVIMAPTGGGKTTWTSWYQDAVVRKSLEAGAPVSTLTLSYEVSEHLMAARTIASISSDPSIPLSVARLSTGVSSSAMQDKIYADISAGLYHSTGYQYYIRLSAVSPSSGVKDYGSAAFSHVERQILSWKKQSKDAGTDPAVVVIDYLTALLAEVPQYCQQAAATSFLAAVRRLAQELNILIIVVSQITTNIYESRIRDRHPWFGAEAIDLYKAAGKTASYVACVVPLFKVFGNNDPYIAQEDAGVVHFYVSKNSLGGMEVNNDDATGVLPMHFSSDKRYATLRSYRNSAIFGTQEFEMDSGVNKLLKPPAIRSANY